MQNYDMLIMDFISIWVSFHYEKDSWSANHTHRYGCIIHKLSIKCVTNLPYFGIKGIRITI